MCWPGSFRVSSFLRLRFEIPHTSKTVVDRLGSPKEKAQAEELASARASM
jgi:hypothetical protein